MNFSQQSVSVVLDRILFSEAPEHHLSFRLRCDQRALVFSNDLVFHTLELRKYAIPSDNTVADLPALEKWLLFLRRGESMTPKTLAALLQEDVFHEAAGVLEMISQSPEDRQFYEARMKALHDDEARMIAAREEARNEGREEGREEGNLVGRIQLLQQLLGDAPSGSSELLTQGRDALDALSSELQERLRTRGS